MSNPIKDGVHSTESKRARSSKSLWAGVRFGAPSKNCAGSGVCEVFQLGREKRPCGCGAGLTSWIVARSPYCLEFRFLNRELSEKVRARQFQDGAFRVEENVTLPAFLRQSLGLKGRNLVRGVYDVRRSSRYTTVRIQIR